MRDLHVQREREENQQINFNASERPGRTSAVTTDFPALIGDGGLPAGTERRVQAQTPGLITGRPSRLHARQETGGFGRREKKTDNLKR